MLEHNPIPVSTRLKELLFDYILILAYLACLALVCLSFYFLVFGEIPVFTALQSQLIATFTSVLPMIAIFSWMDSRGGSWGKKKAGLRIVYQKSPLSSALIRNSIKFLPWQLGHMGTISGIYSNYTSLFGHICTFLSLGLLILLLVMAIKREDKRHLGDLLAGSQVVMKSNRK